MRARRIRVCVGSFLHLNHRTPGLSRRELSFELNKLRSGRHKEFKNICEPLS